MHVNKSTSNIIIQAISDTMVPTTLQNSFSLTFQDKMNRFPSLICSHKIPIKQQ